MAKKKGKKDEEVQEEIRPFEIIGATLVDDILSTYSYEVMTGPTAGETHTVKGKNVIHEDLREAFRTLNRHLAAVDDAFDSDLKNIDSMENDISTAPYDVHAFKIKGTKDNQTIILIGTKHVRSISSRNDITTDKISIEEYSHYKWYNELKDAANVIREEVLQYMHGKCTPREEFEVSDPNQLSITDSIDEFKEAKL